MQAKTFVLGSAALVGAATVASFFGWDVTKNLRNMFGWKRGELHIRAATRRELDTLFLQWAIGENWNTTPGDTDSWWAADPHGFFVGEVDGEVVAMISAVAYGETDGFVGFYICKQSFRGKGYGLKMFQHGMNYLQDRNVALDGVPAQVSNYEKSGFTALYKDINYIFTETKSESEARAQIQRKLTTNFPAHTSVETGVRVVNYPSPGVYFPALLKYMEPFFATPREEYYRKFVHQPTARVVVALRAKEDRKRPEEHDQHDAIVGYALVRKAPKGYKVAPVFAESRAVARELIRALIHALPLQAEEFVSLSIPDYHHESIAMVTELGFVPSGFLCEKMYTKGRPSRPDDVHRMQTFASSSLEVG